MSKINVLIVDDNQDLADGLGMVLEDENYNVSLAYNGADAISEFDKGHFDFAFIDVKLPDMNGVEVFQYIHKKDSNINAILMTGYRVEQLLAEVIDNGEIEILLKPFEIEQALEIVRKIKKESIVLIADDDPDFSEGLSDYLGQHGMKTLLARNGQEAVDTVLSNSIDVLILDLRMPIICGLEVYLQLKQQGRAVKTIIVTGYGEEEKETINLLKSTSITGCLFKPFKPEDMLLAIEQAMNS